MRLGDHGINRRNLRQGGGRGTGEDHVDDLFGAIELFVYQTPNTRPKGYLNLKSFLEAQGCEVISGQEAPPELERYESIKITLPSGEPLPNSVVNRAHKWAHQRNYLHSFFKPMYQ